ncbi:MAG TPA: pyridoxamine 5'-phosphate oxidase [Acidimicrobiales bacterium]|nr:pyridoxamine 5'-phosphate oxidase [Acidimicrobiales bacterium]
MPDHARPLHEHSVDADPFAQFALWYEEAAAVVRLPEAMAVATAGSDGRPSVRMVLLKGWDRRGFVFYTSYRGRKGRELAQNPVAALMFHWDPLGRQVRVEGPVERLPAAESDAYFASRPRGAQVSALASEQSRPIESRELLEARVEARSAELGQGPVPRPAWWGGFRVRPGVFEFWQHRDDRLHDRLVYVPDGGTDRWRIVRLQP